MLSKFRIYSVRNFFFDLQIFGDLFLLGIDHALPPSDNDRSGNLAGFHVTFLVSLLISSSTLWAADGYGDFNRPLKGSKAKVEIEYIDLQEYVSSEIEKKPWTESLSSTVTYFTGSSAYADNSNKSIKKEANFSPLTSTKEFFWHTHFVMSGHLNFPVQEGNGVSMPVIIEVDYYGPHIPAKQSRIILKGMSLRRLAGKKIADVFASSYYGMNLSLPVGFGGQLLFNLHGIVLVEGRAYVSRTLADYGYRIVRIRPANEAQFQRVQHLEIH